MLRNMKLATKLAMGFGFLLVILASITGFSYLRFRTVDHLAHEVVEHDELLADVLQKITDHVQWVGKVKDMFADDRVTQLQVQTDDTKCGLGQWLQSEKVKKIVSEDSEIDRLTREIAGPHHRLHASAIKISEQYIWDGYVQAQERQRETIVEWDRIAHDLSSLPERAMEDVIDPAKGAAEGTRDVEAIVKWGEIDMIMNERVIAPFLSLRIEAEGLASTPTDEQWSVYQGQLQEARNGINEWARLVEKNTQLRSIAGEIREHLRSFEATGERYHEAMLDQRSASASMSAAMETLQNETEPAAEETIEVLMQIRDRLAGQAQGATTQISNSIDQTILLVAVTSIPAIMIGILAAIFITGGITKPINRIIAGLNEGSDQVASASGQVSSSSQSLAEGASEQAASIEETSSSLEEMSSMTKQNADNAHQADSLMKEANQVVGQANNSMTELTDSMKEISEASDETSKIIKTIDEIAFQTNLLALNAAVEAARAGEAGAGFAVVADEVRNLAMRAADAAKDTAALIEGTVKKVGDGSALVTRTNEAFTEVAESAGKVGELVGEIAAASNEQAQGIDQTNRAVAEMDRVVQQNAANAEESASASEEMNSQAQQMKSMVNELVLLVGGSSNGGVSRQTGVPTTGAAPRVRGPRITAHRPAAVTAQPAVAYRAKPVKPEEVIPMDDDFKDF